MVLGLCTQEEHSSSLVLGNGGIIREDVSARNVALQMHNGQGIQLGEEKSGVGWKFANQGLNLLSLAVNDSSSINSQIANVSFVRQLYLHAIAYLLQGLPSDLTMEEQLSIRSSLPPGIVQSLRVEVSNSDNISTTSFPRKRSLLHRTLSSSIVELFLFFQFLLPYFTYFLAAVYQYDREHKIVQRGIAQGMETLNQVGGSSVALGSVVLEMGDGKVGQAVGELTKWLVEGITGGIQEGVGEVMIIVGTSKARGQRR